METTKHVGQALQLSSHIEQAPLVTPRWMRAAINILGVAKVAQLGRRRLKHLGTQHRTGLC